jgi:hypothetical protein
VTCALRGLHELCHWLAARAEGVAAKVRIDRRLYFFVFETDLTGLWGLPRRRRYWPMLIGLGFDTVILATVLALRLAAHAGLWHVVRWVASTMASADPQHGAFWEALGLSVVLLWPELLVLWVAARELARKTPVISRRTSGTGLRGEARPGPLVGPTIVTDASEVRLLPLEFRWLPAWPDGRIRLAVLIASAAVPAFGVLIRLLTRRRADAMGVLVMVARRIGVPAGVR